MQPSSLARAFSQLPSLIWSGIQPSGDEKLAWYDRAIRVGGGILILAVLLFGLVAVAVDTFSH